MHATGNLNSLFSLLKNGKYAKIWDVSWVENITAGDDFLGLCDQKSSHQHGPYSQGL
jgi:hypothetical protein